MPSLAVTSVLLLAISSLPPALADGDANPGAGGTDDVTTIVLVRHAEKDRSDPQNRDPHLTAGGETRARALVHALADLEIDAIYATPFHRTRDTAAPLAEAHGLDVVEAPVADHASAMAEVIGTRHAGQTVVVSGHSNTTPSLARALGATDVPDIADDVFDHLWIVTVVPGRGERAGEVRLLRLRYGWPTP